MNQVTGGSSKAQLKALLKELVLHGYLGEIEKPCFHAQETWIGETVGY